MLKSFAGLMFILALSACGGNSDTKVQDSATCAATTNVSLMGTKASGATCTDASQCSPVDCADNTCRAACTGGKCASPTAVCQ